jgi:ABC-type glycerol-3-phosphate transport system substrate-binding protein
MGLKTVRASLWFLVALFLAACGGHGTSSTARPAPTVTLTRWDLPGRRASRWLGHPPTPSRARVAAA